MTTEELKRFSANYTAAWNSQNSDSVALHFCETGSLYVNGTPAKGREAISDVAQGFMSAFPDMELVMDKLDLESERIQYHWTFIGTNTGPEGTGNAVKFSGYEEWTFDSDGLIEISMGHFNNDEYEYQLEHGV